MMTPELIDELQVGTRMVAGTDWPVIDQLWRRGPHTWEIVRELCNGVPRARETFRSEAAAREAFGSRIEGRKPRAGKPATERIALRITADEKRRWTEAGAREGKELSRWIIAAAELAWARGSTR